MNAAASSSRTVRATLLIKCRVTAGHQPTTLGLPPARPPAGHVAAAATIYKMRAPRFILEPDSGRRRRVFPNPTTAPPGRSRYILLPVVVLRCTVTPDKPHKNAAFLIAIRSSSSIIPFVSNRTGATVRARTFDEFDKILFAKITGFFFSFVVSIALRVWKYARATDDAIPTIIFGPRTHLLGPLHARTSPIGAAYGIIIYA